MGMEFILPPPWEHVVCRCVSIEHEGEYFGIIDWNKEICPKEVQIKKMNKCCGLGYSSKEKTRIGPDFLILS
jgi:hypothetical protein